MVVLWVIKQHGGICCLHHHHHHPVYIYILYILELTKLFYNTSVGVHLWRRSSTLASIPPWMRPP